MTRREPPQNRRLRHWKPSGWPPLLTRPPRASLGPLAEPPFSWPVSLTDGEDGTTVIRYAYRDGTAANVVVPTSRHGEYDHTTLARFVKEPPPPPRLSGR